MLIRSSCKKIFSQINLSAAFKQCPHNISKGYYYSTTVSDDQIGNIKQADPFCLRLPSANSNNNNDCGPVSAQEFSQILKSFLKICPDHVLAAKKLGLAFSGGSDSLALALLLKSTVGESRIKAYVVQHNLDPECAVECSSALELAKSLGFEVELLNVDWTKSIPREHASVALKEALKNGFPPPKPKMQQFARTARYSLLWSKCIQDNIPLMLCAHNLDDDVVTSFYRLSRHSNIEGIAGMNRLSIFPEVSCQMASEWKSDVNTPLFSDKILLGRPLLSIPKARLVATCKAANVNWVQDSSNFTTEYLRNSLHQQLCAIQDENSEITIDSLRGIVEIAKLAREKTRQELIQVMEKSIIVDERKGTAMFALNDPVFTERAYLTKRIIGFLAQYASNKPFPIRTAALDALIKPINDAMEEYKEGFCKPRQYDTYGFPRRRKLINNAPINSTTWIEREKLIEDSRVQRLQITPVAIGGSLIYPLNSEKSIRILEKQSRLKNRKVSPGPLLLIQREKPPKTAIQAKTKQVNLKPNNWILFDNRFWLSYETLSQINENDENAVVDASVDCYDFTITFGSIDSIKAIEQILFDKRNRCHQSEIGLRQLWSWTGSTPSPLYYSQPMIKHVRSGWIGFPTIGPNVVSVPNIFKWDSLFASNCMIYSKTKIKP